VRRLTRQVIATLSRTQSKLIVLGLVLGLFCWIFADVIFRDRNFCYRDAGHFYYPLLEPAGGRCGILTKTAACLFWAIRRRRCFIRRVS
jgi:hypothetical protein